MPLPHHNMVMASRFRGYLPVVVDIETAGFDAQKDAMLEIAAVIIDMDEKGEIYPGKTLHHHIEPFEGANLDPKALAFNGIDPHHPFRMAVDEKHALNEMFKEIRAAMKGFDCTRAILVAHNAFFDQSFLNAAVERAKIKRSPFHPFSSFDTATLSGLAFGQTVLARAMKEANIPFNEEEAHSAKYDAEKTAELFCTIVNRWREMEINFQQK